MKYPASLRSFLAALPFGLHIDGQARLNVLRVLDFFFHPSGECAVPVGQDVFVVDPVHPNERLFYYAPHNMLVYARQSALFGVIQRVFADKQAGAFVDVGANMGLYSYLARQLGADALLFEPEPAHHAFLKRNALRFGAAFPYALSDRRGTARFHVGDARHAGASSLVTPEDGTPEGSPYQASVDVQVTTFDDALKEAACNPTNVALVKVDVEGNEARTVRGMNGYLARADAAPVWCEVRGPASDRNADSQAAVTRLMAEHGYHPYRFEDGQLTPFDAETDGPLPQVFDLLFLKPARHEAIFSSSPNAS